MNIMDKTTAKISLHIDGMTWEQVREMIEERYGALMWDHKSTAYPTDSVVVRMAFAEPAGNVAQRAIGKAAPQQEAQEPVAWYVTGCSRLLDEDEANAEARHIGGTARAIPLYTAPQADSVQDLQPVHDAVTIDLLNERVAYLERKLKEADSVLEDAARYRYLTRSMGDYCVTYADENGGGVLKAAAADAAIDAARTNGDTP